jgi:hypothetical protein
MDRKRTRPLTVLVLFALFLFVGWYFGFIQFDRTVAVSTVVL